MFLFIYNLTKLSFSQRYDQQDHTIEIMTLPLLHCVFLFEDGDDIPWLVSCLNNKKWESSKFSFWRQTYIISDLKFFSKRKKQKNPPKIKQKNPPKPTNKPSNQPTNHKTNQPQPSSEKHIFCCRQFWYLWSIHGTPNNWMSAYERL